MHGGIAGNSDPKIGQAWLGSAAPTSNPSNPEKVAVDTEAVRRAEGDMNAAAERLQNLAGNNAPFGSRQGAENRYGEAFARLVQLGARRKLRGKYRNVR